MASPKAPLAVKGMNDVFPNHPDAFLDSSVWQHILRTAQHVAEQFGYAHVHLPAVEETALFSRGLGEQTDVVSKEMYSFTDRGERQLSLRPEGTAGAVRAYVEHHLGRNEPQQRWFYTGPMYRAERPQKGRYRQFYQLGCECFGLAGPGVDVELLQMLQMLCEKLDVGDTALRINTLGDAESRQRYLAALSSYFAGQQDALCSHCKVRLDKNPLRVLDCKVAACQQVVVGAPDILLSLTDASTRWFASYEQLLNDAGVAYSRDKLLVRGLDYYTEAIFEITSAGLGAQDALMGGGRYDGLVASLGGPVVPAVGFAAGIERLALRLSERTHRPAGVQLFLAVQAYEGLGRTLKLAAELRALGLQVEVGSDEGKLKAALKRADRSRAQVLAVIGSDELAQDSLRLKHLADGSTFTCAWDAQALAARLRSDRAANAVVL